MTITVARPMDPVELAIISIHPARRHWTASSSKSGAEAPKKGDPRDEAIGRSKRSAR